MAISPEKFEKYLEKQIIHARNDYKKDMIFIFAWNEWGEGGYLEPDEKYGYKGLEAIKTALKKHGRISRINQNWSCTEGMRYILYSHIGSGNRGCEATARSLHELVGITG